MGNANAVFAGIAGDLKSATALLYVAPVGTPIPGINGTGDPFADLDPTLWHDVGYVTQDGFSMSQDVDKTEINAFGAADAVRILKTKFKREGSITFLETNPIVLDIVNSLPIGTTTVGANGLMQVKTGQIRTQRYAGVISATDGENRMRLGLPIFEATPSGEMKLSMGEALERPISMNALPDSTNGSVYENYLIPSLATATPAA